MAIDKVKRSLIWLRQTLRITEKTTLPGEILGEIRPTVDSFGWDRLNPQSSGEGVGPQSVTIFGSTALAQMVPVPEGVMRYIIYASHNVNDALFVGLLFFEVVSDGIAAAVQAPFRFNLDAQNVPVGLERHLLLAPGDVLRGVSSVAVAGGSRNELRARFVDIDFGEYIPPVV
ncbi:MAG: hypothetical protein V3S55_10495 [Nitrospiraceae bacterium]